jgi:stress-induced-phosphoprotein 1
MFSDPNLIAKLAGNSRTAKHLADPKFMNLVRPRSLFSFPPCPYASLFRQLSMIQKNPSLAGDFMNSDPRLIDVLGVLFGVDMQGFSRPEGSDELPPGLSGSSSSASPPPPTSPPQASSSSRAEAQKTKDVVMEEAEPVDDGEARAKAEAEAEKKAGAEAYKKRALDDAERHFSRAWDVWPKDITFLTNLAAVYFEKGEYGRSIETCEKAVEEGREVRLSVSSPVAQHSSRHRA